MNRFAPVPLAFSLSLSSSVVRRTRSRPNPPNAPALKQQAHAAGVQAQTKVTAAPVGALPVRLRAEDGREIRGDGTTTVMKAEDFRKITTNGDGTMVLDESADRTATTTARFAVAPTRGMRA